MSRQFREVAMARRAKAAADEIGERLAALELRPDGSARLEFLAPAAPAVLPSVHVPPPPFIVPYTPRQSRRG